MIKEVKKESKEEKAYKANLELHYEKTEFCKVCGMKLAMDGSCDSLICN